MLAPNDLSPFIDGGRFLLGLSLFASLLHPQATRSYRLRFWLSVLTIAGIAIVGLRILRVDRNLSHWPVYAAVFQAVGNAAVVTVLMVRYKLYMPRG